MSSEAPQPHRNLGFDQADHEFWLTVMPHADTGEAMTHIPNEVGVDETFSAIPVISRRAAAAVVAFSAGISALAGVGAYQVVKWGKDHVR